MPVSDEWSVEEVMRRWPGTVRVFLDFRLRCVGCPIACFHSIAEACRAHQVDQEVFLAALRHRISLADPRIGLPPA